MLEPKERFFLSYRSSLTSERNDVVRIYFVLSLDLRELAHSRPVSQGSFRRHVETVTAP